MTLTLLYEDYFTSLHQEPMILESDAAVMAITLPQIWVYESFQRSSFRRHVRRVRTRFARSETSFFNCATTAQPLAATLALSWSPLPYRFLLYFVRVPLKGIYQSNPRPSLRHKPHYGTFARQ